MPYMALLFGMGFRATSVVYKLNYKQISNKIL
jgi:hypothetical protein